jgi:hypothetical protein
MITLPQPNDPTNTPATVTLTEDAETVLLLLRWVYPSNRRLVLPSSFLEYARLFAVARKYEVASDTLRPMLRQNLPLISPEPLEEYLFCALHDLVPEGRAAAHRIIAEGINFRVKFWGIPRDLAAILDAKGTAVSNVYALINLQDKFYEAVKSSILTILHAADGCTCNFCVLNFPPSGWVDEYLQSIGNPLGPSSERFSEDRIVESLEEFEPMVWSLTHADMQRIGNPVRVFGDAQSGWRLTLRRMTETCKLYYPAIIELSLMICMILVHWNA